MKFKCKECGDTDDFDDAEDARDNDWRRVGSRWVCSDCFDEEERSDDDDDDERSGFGNFSNRSSGFSFGGGGAKA